MNLPAPPERYSQPAENQRNVILSQADGQNLKRNTDIDMASGAKLILRSPNGHRWNITVNNAGVIAAVAL